MLQAQSEQDISVYSSSIEREIKGTELNSLNYEYFENGVVNYNNGVWAAVRLEIPAELAKNDNFIYLSYALLDTVEMWIEDGNEMAMVHQTGQAFEFHSRPYVNSDFVFPIIEGQEVYYFRIYSSKPVVLPFKIQSEKALFQNLTRKDFLFGIYVGIIFVMILYNLALFFIIQDKSYALYIIYLFTLVITQAALFGYTDRFLMPDWTSMNLRFAALSGAMVAISSVFFVSNFLELKTRAPLYARLFFLVVILDSIGIIFLLMGWGVLGYHWVNFTSLYGSIIGLIAGVKLSRTGFKPAKFFLIAWSVFLTSVIVFALMNIGILPYNPYFHSSMLFGSSIEVVLLSVALADRINLLRKEKAESQEKALEMAKENERIIQEQNAMLEEKVHLRTAELQDANKELTETLNNLRSAQSQLVQSEKMASLGLLTAGVAHELNNPLNYIMGSYTVINDRIQKENPDLKEEELKEYLQWIRSGAEKATKIVKSLNIYSRTNEDYTEDCNLNSIIEGCLSILQHKMRGQIEVNSQLSKDLNTIKGNSGKLHQVILNLIDNAIDSIENSGTLHIKSNSEQEGIKIIIQDNGQGISQENLRKVLDPFFTTKSPGKGTGLGLSIVHSIIQEHGGRINFESELGKGTKVTLTFP